MKKEIFIKYLDNKCSEKEFDAFADWVDKDAAGKSGEELVAADWNTFSPDHEDKDAKKYASILDKIHHQINLNAAPQKEGKVVSTSRAFSWFRQVAAVLFVPLVVVAAYLFFERNFEDREQLALLNDSLEVIAPIGSRTVVDLPDGTKVHLNYGSKIKYPQRFADNSREVKLEGEGFFAVHHNPACPFIVKTEGLRVKALGTVFNVEAYADAETVATTLVEGKVVIEKELKNSRLKNLGAMTPGQHVSYDKQTGMVYSSKGNIEKYIGWTDGKLIFDNEPIDEVVKKLNRMFNVDIEYDNDVTGFAYTVTFVDEPLFLILDLMKDITPIDYEVFPRKKLPNGTYSKQRIKIVKQ